MGESPEIVSLLNKSTVLNRERILFSYHDQLCGKINLFSFVSMVAFEVITILSVYVSTMVFEQDYYYSLILTCLTYFIMFVLVYLFPYKTIQNFVCPGKYGDIKFTIMLSWYCIFIWPIFITTLLLLLVIFSLSAFVYLMPGLSIPFVPLASWLLCETKRLT
jgi:hypothetical protein